LRRTERRVRADPREQLFELGDTGALHRGGE
jgi:hypothetical protein